MPTARIEIHTIDSVTLTTRQFLAGAKNGTPARIGGELRLPPGTPRMPVVLLVHGSAGVGANVDYWVHQLNTIGVATFTLDCFTGRNILETVTDQSRLGHLAMIVDAYRALDLLARHSAIDPARIAIMGFSKGGFAALYASLHRFRRMHGPTDHDFAAYIPFYPPCGIAFLEDEQVSAKPIRIHHGAADNYVAIDPTREYVERLRRAGKDVQLTEYPGAHHAFDNPLYSPPIFHAEAVTTNHCPRQEQPDGEIINVETGKPFTPNDPCVKRGANLAYHEAATKSATHSVKSFLKAQFHLHL